MLYQPTFFNPNGNTIDPSMANTFSCQIQGSVCVAYELTIRKNSDNSIIHNSGKVNLPTPLYNQQTLEVSLNQGILIAGTDYKWRVKLYWNATNFVESGEIYFKAYNSPTLTLTIPPTINSNNYTFSATYNQTQGIPVKYFIFNLFDNSGALIKSSNKIYSANVQFNFDGFISSNTYRVQCIAVDQNDLQGNTGVISFKAEYPSPSLNIKPIANLLEDKNAIRVRWSNAIQINGQSSGSHTFTNNTFYSNSTSVNIHENSTVYYDTNIPKQFTILFVTKLPVGFAGKIVELFDVDDNEIYEVGYDGVHFYYIIDGYRYIIPRPLPTNPILMALRPTNLYIREF